MRLTVISCGPLCGKELVAISTQKFYIRPIQVDIKLNELVMDEATESCVVCGMLVSITHLRDHVDECQQVNKSLCKSFFKEYHSFKNKFKY